MGAASLNTLRKFLASKEKKYNFRHEFEKYSAFVIEIPRYFERQECVMCER